MFPFNPFDILKRLVAFFRREYGGIKAFVEDKLL